jgi:hypothetical protein
MPQLNPIQLSLDQGKCYTFKIRNIILYIFEWNKCLIHNCFYHLIINKWSSPEKKIGKRFKIFGTETAERPLINLI